MNKLIRKNINSCLFFLIAMFTISSISLSAQKNPLELSISGGGGFSTFCLQPPVKKATSAGYSIDVALGFTGFLSQQWGIHVGLGWGVYNVKTKIDKLHTVTPGLIDRNRYLFDLHTTLNNYEETQKTMFLYIPLMVQFQTTSNMPTQRKKGAKPQFYAMAGPKMLVLFNNNYEAKLKSLYNAAYYPEFDNWADTQIFAGLSSFNGNKVGGKFKLNILVMLAFEAGVKWHIGKKTALYTGAFFDCGLNDNSKTVRKPFEHYIYAENLKDFTLLKFTNKINLMTIGVRVRLAFSPSKKETGCPYNRDYRCPSRYKIENFKP